MDNLKQISNTRLKQLIIDTQDTLHELTNELERREESQQNHEIDNLDTHMESVELSLSKIKEFIVLLVQEHKKTN